MAISLGDAVLVFKGDDSQLNAAFAAVPGNAQKSFGEATKVVSIFQDELDATGDNVRYAGEKILSLSEAFRTLSISGPERLKQRLDDARNAFDTLTRAGVEAKGTLLQASIKVTERELAYKKALGDSTDALNRQLTALQGQYAKLGGPVEDIAQNLQFAGRTASTFAQTATQAGEAMEGAAHRGSEAFHETRGSIDLLADQLGVRLPREIKSFLAGIEGIQGVLAGAFGAVAIIGIGIAIVEVTKKVYDWYEATVNNTEAQKNLNTVLAESAGKIRDYNAELTKLIRAREEMGKTAPEIAAARVRFATEDVEKAAKAYRDAGDAAKGFELGLITRTNAIKAYNEEIRKMNVGVSEEDLVKQKKLLGLDDTSRNEVLQKLKAFTAERLAESKIAAQKLDDAQDEEGQKLTDAQNSFDQASIAATQSTHAQRIAIDENQARIRLALQGATYSQLLASQKQYEEARYQNQLQAEQQTLGVLQRDPEKNVDAIVAQNAKIEALEQEHQAKQLADLATFIEKRRAILEEARRPGAGALDLIQAPDAAKFVSGFVDPITGAYHAAMEQIQTDTTIAIRHVLDAYRELGIQGSLLLDQTGNLVTPLEQAQGAYDKLRTSGLASYSDLLQAQIAVKQAEIEHNKELGQSTQEQEDQLDRLLDKWARFTGQIRQNQIVVDTWRKETQKNFNHVDAAMKYLRDSGKSLLDQISNALANAFAQWILGQQSLGRAVAQAVAQVLAAWAGAAAVKALISAGEGFYLLAIHDYEGAANAFHAAAILGTVAAVAGAAAAGLSKLGTPSKESSPNAPANLPPTPATTASSTAGTVNAVHLAAGGLISQPTLAIVGDSLTAGRGGAREAVLPLDDARAMDAIAGAVVERLRSDIALPNPPQIQDYLAEFFGRSPVVQNFHVKGNLIDHGKLMKQVSRQVDRGTARLTSSNAFRVTRRA